MTENHVVITGGAGHVGSYLAARFLTSGFQVTVIDKLNFGVEPLIPLLSSNRFRLWHEDAYRHDVLEFITKGDFQLLIHAAAIVGEPAAKKQNDASSSLMGRQCTPNTVDINVGMTKAIAESYGKVRWNRGPLFVYLSTCSVYGIAEGLADETSPVDPQGDYARTKLEAEKPVLDVGGTVLRMGTIVGLSPRMRWDTMAHEFIRDLHRKSNIEVREPQANRPFLRLGDLYWVLLNLLSRRSPGQCFNVSTCNLTKMQLAEMVLSLSGVTYGSITQYGLSGQDARNYQVSCKKLCDHLGPASFPSISINTDIQEIWAAIPRMNDAFAKRYFNV